MIQSVSPVPQPETAAALPAAFHRLMWRLDPTTVLKIGSQPVTSARDLARIVDRNRPAELEELDDLLDSGALHEWVKQHVAWDDGTAPDFLDFVANPSKFIAERCGFGTASSGNDALKIEPLALLRGLVDIQAPLKLGAWMIASTTELARLLGQATDDFALALEQSLTDGTLAGWICAREQEPRRSAILDCLRLARGLSGRATARDTFNELRFFLDPAAPLSAGSGTIRMPTDIVTIADSGRGRGAPELIDLVRRGTLERWLVARDRSGASYALASEVCILREALEAGKRDIEDTFDALCWIFCQPLRTSPTVGVAARSLDKRAWFRLTTGVTFVDFRDLAQRFANDPALLAPILRALSAGTLDDWLRLTHHPQRDAFQRALDSAELRDQAGGYRPTSVYAVCLAFWSSMPFPFNKEECAETPVALARLIDRDDAHRKKGTKLLLRGDIVAWLSGRRDPVAGLIEGLLRSIGGNNLSDAQLDKFLRTIDPTLFSVEPEARPAFLSLGTVEPGTQHLRTIHVVNRGRGVLSGEVEVTTQKDGFRVSVFPEHLSEIAQDIAVTAAIGAEGIYRTKINLATRNERGHSMAVPIFGLAQSKNSIFNKNLIFNGLISPSIAPMVALILLTMEYARIEPGVVLIFIVFVLSISFVAAAMFWSLLRRWLRYRTLNFFERTAGLGADSQRPDRRLAVVGFSGGLAIALMAWLGMETTNHSVSNCPIFGFSSQLFPAKIITANYFWTVEVGKTWRLPLLDNDRGCSGYLQVTEISPTVYGRARIVEGGRAIEYQPTAYGRTENITYRVRERGSGEVEGRATITIANKPVPPPPPPPTPAPPPPSPTVSPSFLAVRPPFTSPHDGMAAPSGAQLPTEPPRATQERRFKLHDNYDLFGNDIEKIRDIAQDDCEAACEANDRCHAFSYDKWNHYCFLKYVGNVLSLEPNSISGILESMVPQFDSQAVAIERYKGKALDGTRFRAPFYTQDNCREVCITTYNCVGYSFSRPSSECNFYYSINNIHRNSDVDSGVKRQPNQ